MAAIDRVLYPATLEEALVWLADPELRAAPLAGGTSLARAGTASVRTLVDVTRLGLDELEARGAHVYIGANVRAESLARSALLDDCGDGILRRAASHVGSRLIRNAATLGGSLVAVYPWSDLALAVRALDVGIEVLGPGARVVPVDEFFARHPRTWLQPGSFVRGIRVARCPDRAGGAYLKFSRTRVDDALATAAAHVHLGPDGRCRWARVVVGAVRPVPTRCESAERILFGEEPSDRLFREAARAARDAIRPLADPRAGREYRSALIEVLVRRTLTEAFCRAAGEGVR
jgi:CO/xanthine dehydrogenase FAD-binding subunit